MVIHSDVSETDLTDDETPGKVVCEFEHLLTECHYELLVYVGNPCLQTDWHVLVHQVHALLFLQHLFDLYYARVVETSEKSYLLGKSRTTLP